jgi:hypothetical protein
MPVVNNQSVTNNLTISVCLRIVYNSNRSNENIHFSSMCVYVFFFTNLYIFLFLSLTINVFLCSFLDWLLLIF